MKIYNGANPVLEKIRRRLKKEKIDALFVSHPPNVSYLTGFKGKESFLIVPVDNTPFFITDFRYYEQAKRETLGCNIVCFNSPLINKILTIIQKYKFKNIGFESGQISFKRFEILKSFLNIKLKSVPGLIEEMRLIKSDKEIDKIKTSAQAAKMAVYQAIEYIRPGMSELEIAGFLEWKMRSAGAQELSFNTIVASGANSSMPHAIPSMKIIKNKEPIIIDCGCFINGYSSDLTRTVFLGRIDAQYKYIYNIVKEAQKRAISSIRPGKAIFSVDACARNFIEKKGLGRYFGHSTGHGIGCEVHEAPSVSAKNKHILKPGMVFTVEPGIYIPGWGGVRIEDIVAVTDKSYKVLT